MVVGKLLKYRITEEIQNDVANALREAKSAVLKLLPLPRKILMSWRARLAKHIEIPLAIYIYMIYI